MGRLTENECMDLFAESLQDDKRKLQSEIARLGAEVVQLKHRLSERADAHDRLRGRAEEAEADLARLRVKYAATHERKEAGWEEAARLRERAERADAVRARLVAIRDVLGHDARADLGYRLRDVIREAIAGLDAAPAGEGGGNP
jgi:chromosome segregation ATPase